MNSRVLFSRMRRSEDVRVKSRRTWSVDIKLGRFHNYIINRKDLTPHPPSIWNRLANRRLSKGGVKVTKNAAVASHWSHPRKRSQFDQLTEAQSLLWPPGLVSSSPFLSRRQGFPPFRPVSTLKFPYMPSCVMPFRFRHRFLSRDRLSREELHFPTKTHDHPFHYPQ